MMARLVWKLAAIVLRFAAWLDERDDSRPSPPTLLEPATPWAGQRCAICGLAPHAVVETSDGVQLLVCSVACGEAVAWWLTSDRRSWVFGAAMGGDA